MIRPTSWKIHQIAGTGSAAGLAALVLWPIYAVWPEIAALPFIILLAVAAACGCAMLWITVQDLGRRPARGNRLRPIRTFDIILGLVLAIPSLIELRAVVPGSLAQLGL